MIFADHNGNIDIIILVDLFDDILPGYAQSIGDSLRILPVARTIDHQRFFQIECFVVPHFDDVETACTKKCRALPGHPRITASVEHVDLNHRRSI